MPEHELYEISVNYMRLGMAPKPQTSAELDTDSTFRPLLSHTICHPVTGGGLFFSTPIPDTFLQTCKWKFAFVALWLLRLCCLLNFLLYIPERLFSSFASFSIASPNATEPAPLQRWWHCPETWQQEKKKNNEQTLVVISLFTFFILPFFLPPSSNCITPDAYAEFLTTHSSAATSLGFTKYYGKTKHSGKTSCLNSTHPALNLWSSLPALLHGT